MKTHSLRGVAKCAALTSIFLMVWVQGISQSALEGHIGYIREQFQLINKRSANVDPLIFRSDTLHADGPMEIKSWRFEGKEIKMQATIRRASGKLVTDYYFGSQGFIFAFVQEYLKDEFNQPYVLENRYYFRDEETLVRWLDKDKKEVDPESERFRKRGNDILNDVHWLSEVFFMYGPKGPSSDADQLSIGDRYFYGITIGQKIEDVAGSLKKGWLKTGEGDFEVYYITDPQGSQLGHIPVEGDKVLTIVITTPKASTWDGLRVGSTFAELKEVLGEVEVHGSEIEGRTSVYKGYFQFLLDAYLYTFDVDETTIPPETKIKAIILRSPA
ncbi:hypothetical protein FNH22_18685 [Fulvivirga sp. M361]|uniref:hypothetical protein n=1 Tax=Fulvivirga sp. M361 TaxID=2594266 RepID=UPI0011799DC4|nr:hypothetical protein [Fulvivirga sp. M361]TRX54788.1 hypothetical protein FNH22_18685 [Fulvivirga sp. M361]